MTSDVVGKISRENVAQKEIQRGGISASIVVFSIW
jgi:hypothetical protein